MPKIICFIGCILWICCQFDLEWEKAVIRANKYLVHIAPYHPSPMKFYNQDVFMNNPYYANLFNELHPPVQLFVVNHLYGKTALIPEKTLKEVFGDNQAYAIAPHLDNAAHTVVHNNCYAGTSFSKTLVNFCLAALKRDFYHWSMIGC